MSAVRAPTQAELPPRNENEATDRVQRALSNVAIALIRWRDKQIPREDVDFAEMAYLRSMDELAAIRRSAVRPLRPVSRDRAIKLLRVASDVGPAIEVTLDDNPTPHVVPASAEAVAHKILQLIGADTSEDAVADLAQHLLLETIDDSFATPLHESTVRACVQGGR